MPVKTRQKVSYVVTLNDEAQAHCLGVNSLAIDTLSEQNSSTLYSAGRDGVVASWDLHLNFTLDGDRKVVDRLDRDIPKTTCKAFSQIHTDWVNDIVLCNGGNRVVSASSDRTIKIWNPESDTTDTVGWHTDFVKCLTFASKTGWVASGGLDRRINIWDLNQCNSILSIDAGPMNRSSTEGMLHNTSSKRSIYALAVNPTGTLLASGSPEKVVRLWDPRSGKRVSKFTGHTDNIRALLISDDGHHILSGSSDSTIKLWSVRAQRCLTTYETHSDSVWSLYSNHPDLKTFYSGSRDGLVNRTEISGHSDIECISLFKEDSGVTKIVALDDSFVWTATSSSSIHRWKSVPPLELRQTLPKSEFNPDIPTSALAKLPANIISENFVSDDSLYANSILSMPTDYEGEECTIIPLRSEPDYIIQGKPGVVSHLILNNRRHVLTEYTNGEVIMWDIIKCVIVKSFGKRHIEEVAIGINGLESFPAWCTIDTKIGALTVQLHEQNCFDCEMYADEIDSPQDFTYREDQRLNMGKWILCHLFSQFIQKEGKGPVRYKYDTSDPSTLKSSLPAEQGESETTETVPVPNPDVPVNNSNFMNRLKNFSTRLSRTPTQESIQTSKSIAQENNKSTKEATEPKEESKELKQEEPLAYSPPSLEDFPTSDFSLSTMLVISEESSETSTGIDVYRGTVGSIGEDADIIIDVAPTWLLNYLLYDKTPAKDVIKLTFVLKPAIGTTLKELPGGSSNRLLTNHVLRVRKIIQYIADKLDTTESSIELLCGDTLLLPTMTLATIKRHIFKSSGDIPLFYRLKQD